MEQQFSDARNVPVGTELRADVCIVGAGAAGITLARSLSGKGIKVLLMEGGGLEYEASSQRMYAGRNIGLNYYDLLSCRLRYFGGTTNHWAGFCLYGRESDFNDITQVPLSGWPFGMNELQADIEWACREIGHDPSDFGMPALLKYAGETPDVLVDPHTPSLETSVFCIGNTDYTRFAKRYAGELQRAEGLQVYLHANLLKVQLDPHGTEVAHLEFGTLEGSRFTVRASRYVLACHALENARQMLLARDVHPNGIGNQSGYVGRCFQEHPHVRSGLMVSTNERFIKFYTADFKKPRIPLLTLRADALQSRGVLNYYCRLRKLRPLTDLKAAVKRLWSKRHQRFDMDALDQMIKIAENTDDLVSHLYNHAKGTPPTYFLLDHRIEQAPNLDSQVVISDRLDSLGMRQLDLKWDINETDLKTFEVGRSAVVRELSAAGLGRFVSEPLTMDYLRKNVGGHWHHIGTTRMSESARDGVVDRNLKVHEVANLYIAGSAVFPRGGLPGPTMLIVALARRLGRHLHSQLTNT